MLVEKTGDLFTSDCPAYGQGVKTMGSMGAGIARSFRERWPPMFEEYRVMCKSGALTPGEIHVFVAADRTIVNLATQRSFRRGAARLDWLKAAAHKVGQLELEGLALPRIGAGLGGLRWADVHDILEQELAPISYVEIWTLE